MKRLLGVGIAATVLTACAAGHAPASQVTNGGPKVRQPSVKTIAAARERVALRKAGKLLRQVALPAGAVRVLHVPVTGEFISYSGLGTSVVTMTAERHAFWRVRQSVESVVNFVKAHPVPGLESSGGGGLPGGSQSIQFYGHGSPMRRMVSVGAARAGGWTYVRVDAGAAWIYPRSPREALPAGVREIDINGGGVKRHVVDAADVARIVRWFGKLTVTPPGANVGCMLVIASRATYVFRSASGEALASATVPAEPANGCDSIEFSLGGKQQTPLIDTTAPKDAFVMRVERLLGVCFGAGPGGGRLSPSCNKAWAGQVATQLLDRFVLPRAAQPLAREPRGDGGLLRLPETVSGSAELVDRHRFWRVRGPLASAEAFVTKHQHGARRTASATAGGPDVPANHSVTFTYVARNTFISSRQVEVTFVSLPGGWTGIRADAQVVWIYPRGQAQMAPAHTRVIEVRAGSISRRITDYRTIERISLRFDHLEVVQPGAVYHCPGVTRGPKVVIEFHATNPVETARAVASGTGFSTQCNPILFSIHGGETSLLGADFVEWLQGVLGVRFR
jgi:hypothetical protein